MICDINRSINIGFISTVLLTLMSYLLMPVVRNLDNTKLLLLFVVMFVICTSIDFFNYCYTKCDSVNSSVKYALFTSALIYLFAILFIDNMHFTQETLIVAGINIILLTCLHYWTCNYRNQYKL